MSSSRSSSSSPEPESIREIVKKSKPKQEKTKEAQDASVVDKHGKNEGDNPNWDYKPPDGFKAMNMKVDEGPFDWDAIKDNDDLELWIVRVPDGLKPKHLQDAKLELSASSSKTARLGSIERKSTTYDVWNLGEDEADTIGGEELRGVTALLPRSKHAGKLYQAPKPIARRLVVSARPTLPTPQSSPEASPVSHQNPPRPKYPKELLTHRFMPIGSLAPVEDDTAMDVDEPAHTQSAKAQQVGEDGERPKKKKKSGIESPTKPKKSKAVS
ncbi:hypothetical protein C8Q70DRAFT_1056094 [Cubamyces menziesii]|uniref:Uncharacterized protein n=1 Tax=Trametes cubensis TaxID=1111947 RepID=A0AAD7XDW8_9APHY|nr:hypothetical protein C8Q70DRAFT_1056094 [Cubamyces menziesii]KAJ8482696.1 hypothetical protein ONZ51_g5175 [Trametes cubensis]